jgi:hypothetical protein
MEGRSVSFRSSTKVAKRSEFCLLQNICYSCLSARLRGVGQRSMQTMEIGSYSEKARFLYKEGMTD